MYESKPLSEDYKAFRKIAHRIGSLLALLVFLGMVGGSDEAVATELIVGIEAEPERFDPITIKNPKGFIVVWQIYEGLFSLDDKGQIAPALAESWETSDSVTWRINLRKGVMFHESEIFNTPSRTRPVTAKDVVASYTAFCSASSYPAFLLTDSIVGCSDYNTGGAQSVEGIKQIDDDTIEIRLINPEPFFLNRLTTPWIAIFPEELMDSQYEDRRGLDLAVGTGPYRMLTRTSSEITLERNSAYWDQSASGDISRLVFRVITNDEVRFAELRKGGIDLMILPPILYPAALEKTGALKSEYTSDFRSQPYSTFNSHMIGINDNTISDVHLRRAMNFGVDRRLIVQSLLYGLADITGGTIPPGINGYEAPFDIDSLYNPELARQELAQSSYDGEAIEMLVHEQAASEQIGQLFQAQMKDIGVNIRLTKVDFNSAIGRMVSGEAPIFSMFLDYVFSSPELILLNIFLSDKRPVPNFWQFSDPNIDEEIQGLREMSSDVSVKKSAEIEQRIMDQAPAIFLYKLNQLILYSNKFGDLTVNGHGYFRFNRLQSRGS